MLTIKSKLITLSIFLALIGVVISCDNFFGKTKSIKLESKVAQKIIGDRARESLLLLKNKDFLKLAKMAHPEKGVRFSPYSLVVKGEDLVFQSKQLPTIINDKTKSTWGLFDGSGEPINMTFREYYARFIFDKDFSNAKQIGYNQILGHGNTINNSFEVYPSAIIVEFHFPGFDPKLEGMDWESLRLVFEEKNKVWYLVGIIHDEWTI